MSAIAVPWWVNDHAAYRRTVRMQRQARVRRRRENPEWEKIPPKTRRGIVFALAANGLTGTEIARELHLSAANVSALLKKIWGLIHFRADARFPMWQQAASSLPVVIDQPPPTRWLWLYSEASMDGKTWVDLTLATCNRPFKYWRRGAEHR